MTSQYNRGMDNLNDILTNMQLEAEQARQLPDHPSLAATALYARKRLGGKPIRIGGSGQTVVKEEGLPLTALAIPSLLTRAKLSKMTRRLEERRLAMQQRKLTWSKRRSKGAFHWKRKAKNKKLQQRKAFEKSAGFCAIINTYGAKAIDPALWDKYVGEQFREYTPSNLSIKKIKRPPGFGQSAYYGNKEWPLTVYSYRVVHKTLGVVWDGEEQRKLDGVAVLRRQKKGQS